MSRALCSVQGHLLGEGRCPQHEPAGSPNHHTTNLQKKTKPNTWCVDSYKPKCLLSNWWKRPSCKEKIYLHLQRTFFPPKLRKHFPLWTSLLTSCVSTDCVSPLSNFILETQAYQVLEVWYPCQLCQKVFPASLHKDLQMRICYMKLFIRHVAQIQAIDLFEFRDHFLKW